MDNVRHLYTVLAILGFVSLPVLMNSERVLPGELFHIRSAEPFSIDKVFPLSRGTPVTRGIAADTQPISVQGVVPAASPAIPQRWIDDPSGIACRRGLSKPADAKAKRVVVAHPCLIV